jgi:hypothetical protein
MDEQAEQPLDLRSCAAQVLGCGRVVERLAGGDQERLVGRQLQSAGAAPRATQRARCGASDQAAVAKWARRPPAARWTSPALVDTLGLG